jgi:hypothetical protein
MVAVVLQQPTSRLVCGDATHLVRRVIGTAVIDDQDFPRLAAPVEVLHHPPKRCPKPMALVVGRHHHRQQRCAHIGFLSLA